LIEAKKLAFEDRARYYADPGFRRPLDALISKDYAARRAADDPQRGAALEWRSDSAARRRHRASRRRRSAARRWCR
jgi:gamma-glutamyltranspeptidase/glutathione hydrolase